MHPWMTEQLNRQHIEDLRSLGRRFGVAFAGAGCGDRASPGSRLAQQRTERRTQWNWAPAEQPANRLSGRALRSVPGLPISLRGGLAQLLPCDGFVALVDTTTSSIFFSARARDTRPYVWKGDPVRAGHPLRVAPVTEKA